MSERSRVLVLGPAELTSSVSRLGFETTTERPELAVIDLRDAGARVAAAALPSELPRVLVAGDVEREYAAAIGAMTSIVDSCEPARLGPAIVARLPATIRPRTRTVLVTGARGGVGRTLLVTNLAHRLAPAHEVCVVDATGSGAGAWWLHCDPSPWSSLEGLVGEMTAEHLGVAATLARPAIRYVGGPGGTPSAAILSATIRIAPELGWLVLVDAPPLFDATTRLARTVAERVLVLTYDDPASLTALDHAIETDDWLVVSQARTMKIGTHAVFRALPRDEPAVATAAARRQPVGGALGRAYDELAEIIAIDAS